MPATDAAELPFLETDPPHWAARGLSRIILAMTVLLVLAALVVNVPETVTGRFTLVPVNGTDPVRTLKEGIVTDVRVRESDTVAQGATLFVLRSSSPNAMLRAIESSKRWFSCSTKPIFRRRSRWLRVFMSSPS